MHTGSRRLLVAIACGLLSLYPAGAAELQLSPTLAIDLVDADATFQEVPDIGPDKYLCLWSGDALQAFFMTTHEDFPGSWKAYLQATERGMKGGGAKSIKIVEAPVFKAQGGAEVRRLDVTYNTEGSDVKQIYYAIKSATGYHAVIVTFMDPVAYASISPRTDKLMTTVRLVPEKK